MKASEYLTRPELGLSKAQVECVTNLANICGIDSLFEGWGNFGGVATNVKPTNTKPTSVGEKLRLDKEKEEKKAKAKEKAEAENKKKKKKKDDGDLAEINFDVVNFAGYASSDDASDGDMNSENIDFDAMSSANKLYNSDNFKDEGEAVPASGVVADLVSLIATVFGYEPDDVAEYRENETEAYRFIDSYIAAMASNVKSAGPDSDASLGDKLTGGISSDIDVTIARKLESALESYCDNYCDNASPTVVDGIKTIHDAIKKTLNASRTKSDNVAQSQTDMSMLAGTSGSWRDYNKRVKNNGVQAYLKHLKAEQDDRKYEELPELIADEDEEVS